jgi:dGTPase
VQIVVQELFSAYMDDVNNMPEEFAKAASSADGPTRARVVADYIAGMTDRYAISAHETLTG